MPGWHSSTSWMADSVWFPLPSFPAASTPAWMRSWPSLWTRQTCVRTPPVSALPAQCATAVWRHPIFPGSSNPSVLAEELKIKKALLINDLEANAWGIPALEAKDVVALNHVKGQPIGNQAVIAAGTGLGEAGMYWDGVRHQVFASEGGHGDFAPRNPLEVELFNYLRTRFGHVSYERIISGPGLVNVFSFLRDTGRGTPPQWLTDEMAHSDPAAAISRAGMDGKCSLCEQALDLFVSIYGAEAGNLALKLMATGGVYLGGGIAPKMLAKLSGPLFMQAFAGKGRMQALLESMPVMVITNDQIALLGAARCAQLKCPS